MKKTRAATVTAMRARGEAKRWPLLVLTGAVVAAGVRVELELLLLVVVVLRAVAARTCQ